jgi:hypothetical protein
VDLKKYVMEVLSTDLTSSDEIAQMLIVKFPTEIKFAEDYGSDRKTLSKAIGPTLYGLKNQGLVEDDGTKWPDAKKWRRLEKEERISINNVLKSLIMLGYAQSENQALRILALRAVRENPNDYKKVVDEAKKMEETRKKLLKTAIGIDKKNGAAS